MITRLTAGPAAALVAAAALLVGPFLFGLTGGVAVSAYILGAIAALVAAKALWQPRALDLWPTSLDPWLMVGAGGLAILVNGSASTLHLVLGFVILAAGLWTVTERRRADHLVGEGHTASRDAALPTAPIETHPGG